MNIYSIDMKKIRFQKEPNYPKRGNKLISVGDPMILKRGEDGVNKTTGRVPVPK